MRTCGVVFSTMLLALDGLAAQPPAPALSLTLGARQAKAEPIRTGFTHTGAGNIDVAQPAADTVVVTMTGVAVAGAHPLKHSAATLQFDLEQCFEVVVDKPGRKGKLALEGRVIGLLRSHKGGGSAEVAPAHAGVMVGPLEIVGFSMPARSVFHGDNLSINDKHGPAWVPVEAGQYKLHEVFAVSASHPHCLKCCKAASAEFAPDPALDPLWISYWEPFHGAAKKDFGFQVILRVVPE
jgi:hypothetical protein